ncbi:MAG TPA: MarR family transcriptional regulator [Candidatus Acidoferrales bacterium]|nr:MarR family transcriptional regulator [Candidatus Acidoferrales bacterium]
MQRLQGAPDECAHEVLDVVPLAMRLIRKKLREHGAQFLSVPQFRTLLFISSNKGASLSEVADHIGLTLPSMSALVDGLVTRNFVVRRTRPEDRRRVDLTLTERGETTLRSARNATQDYLKVRFSGLSESERGTILKGMKILRRVFSEKVE